MSKSLNSMKSMPDPQELKVCLARKRLSAFIWHTLPNYQMGWVHKEICAELDSFLDAVIRKESPRLMLTMPPRSGKTEVASRRFPAYALGRYPDLSIIAASYSADLASRNNRDVQRIIDSEQYMQIFPDTRLSGKNSMSAAAGSYIRNSDIFEVVGHRGTYRSAGVGGGITGMGAECVEEDTAIMTPNGEVLAKNILAGMSVMAYNQLIDKIEICTVEAVKVRYAESINELYSEQGRSLKVTGNHPIYSEGQYIPANTIAEGAPILCGVWEKICRHGLSIQKKDKKWSLSRFLFSRMFNGLGEPKGERKTFVCCMWKTMQKGKQILRKLHQGSKTLQKMDYASAGKAHLPRVHEGVCCIAQRAWRIRTDFITKNKKIHERGKIRVIDIQVSKCHNFFANGILVHNCLIIDDPIKDRAEADSQTIRNKIWDWYTSTAYTRLAPGGGIIVINTRWHMDDLSGRLLEAQTRGEGDKWKVINFPAIAETDEPHRKAGEALHPERYPLEQLLAIKQAVGSRDWEALYQQHPVPDGGAIFKEEWLQRRWTKLPEMSQVIISWDMSFKEGTSSDYVVGQVWGRSGADLYLIDQARGRWGFTETLAQFKALYAKYPHAYRILIEDKANGPAVIDTLKHEIPKIIPIEPDGSKEARAHAVTPLFESGNVYLPADGIYPWLTEYTSELLQFPSGAHDDQVDATTQAIRDFDLHKPLVFSPETVQKLRSRWR